MPDKLPGFKYISLETFRKNGTGVRTPVWFVEKDNAIYVRTLEDSWKIKRIKATRRARVAPCDFNGRELGEWFEVNAEIIPFDLNRQIAPLFRAKYGISAVMTSLLATLR
ncbi:MAG: PPOX class F420-dependent oxidoreductase, partial [Conexivisphaerales archaeon]